MSPFSLGVTLPAPGASLMALIAQILPDARSYAAFGWWWIVLVGIFGGLATIVGLVLAVWTLVERIRGRQTTTIGDQPLQVAAAVRWARHDELHQLRSEFDQFEKAWTQNAEALRAKIDEKFSESIHASNSSASRVHNRIDAMAGVQGQLVGKVEQMNDNIRLLLQRMGERKS